MILFKGIRKLLEKMIATVKICKSYEFRLSGGENVWNILKALMKEIKRDTRSERKENKFGQGGECREFNG